MPLAHAVVRTDRLAGTDVRSKLVSLVYKPSGTATAIDNGNVVVLGALLSGEREIYAAATPAATNTIHELVLVATPEVMYDERLSALEDFYNEAGETARGYRLGHGDCFSVTAEALSASATIAVGNFVEPAASTKLKVTSAAGDGTVGKVIAVEVSGRYTYYVIEII